MDNLKFVLTQLKEWGGLLTPFGIVFGFLWKFWLKQRLVELKELYASIKKISEEFRPNGGSTLRDAINRIEEKITIQAQKTVAIIKSLPLGTWISDKHGKCIDLNKSLCRITGRTESEIKGDNWTNWIHADDRDEVVEEWNRCVNSMMDFDMSYRFVLPDGRIQRVHGVAYQLRDENSNLMGFLGTLYAVESPV